MLAQMGRPIADVFVFVAFYLFHAEPKAPKWGLYEGRDLFVRKQLEGEGLVGGFKGGGFKGGGFKGGGLLE